MDGKRGIGSILDAEAAKTRRATRSLTIEEVFHLIQEFKQRIPEPHHTSREVVEDLEVFLSESLKP